MALILPGLVIDDILDSRLLHHDARPVAVAYSGGGDSLGLLLAANRWSKHRGRRLVALTVDHRLQPDGAAWARLCAQRATGLGMEHRILVWEGEKPTKGLSAAAREARHRLLAMAAQAAGAAVILMGHTADDVAEAARMRAQGSTTPSPKVWGPSPAWPEGRGVFLLRPLLNTSRSAIRAALLAVGETWIEDPANADPASARARARMALAGENQHAVGGSDAPPNRSTCAGAAEAIDDAIALDEVWEGPAGNIDLPVRRLAHAPDAVGLIGAALVCAGGGNRAPRRMAIERLCDRIVAGDDFAVTLAGVAIRRQGDRIGLTRDVADRRGRIARDVTSSTPGSMVWDGRILFEVAEAGARVCAAGGRAARLPPALRQRLRGLPAAVRPAVPVVVFTDGEVACPTIEASPRVTARSLTLGRLLAARGAIVNEAGLSLMAKCAHPS